MPFQCPHCQSSIVIEGKPPREIVCPACGSSIQLDPGGTTGWLPEEAPKRLGKFELLEQLGVGSFGTVYKARDTELDRLVAVKIPRSGSVPQAEDMDRFLREAKSAAQLKHPGIVSLYDAGTIDGTCCLVSEFIQGATLAERLSAKRFGARQAAELIAEVADALHYAHQHGVIHRDLKPSNIMLDLKGRPHLMDFGLAKRAADEVTVTLEGQVLGTPAYMAPEQARGEVRKVDARSDLYGLGVILYELLTGELPFRGQTRMLLVQVIQDEPRPPRRLNDRIPRDLETICLKAMAKEPARRYQTAGGLADDLRRFLKGEPIQARPVGQVERLRRWCRRNPLVASLTATIAFLLVVGTTVATYFAVDATLARYQADAKEKEALDNAQKALAKEKEALDNAQKEADERKRADREADAAWANQYIAHVNRMESDWENANVGRILETLDVYRKPPPGRKDVRGWEWYYQERLCSQELRTFAGHTSAVVSVAFSPDGVRLASTSWDGTVKLWDGASGQELRTLKGHTGIVQATAFSPDGTRLASAGTDRTVRLWDVANRKEPRILQGHTRNVCGVAFSPDGARLASASWDGTVKLWDAASGQNLRTLRGHTAKISGVAFSPDGVRLASASDDGTVKLWDAASGRELRTLKGHTDPVVSVAFSPDGTRLASASWDQTVKLWAAADGLELGTLKGHTGGVWSVTFSPEGAHVASASDDTTVKLWDAANGQEVHTFKGHTISALGVAFSPDGTWLASAGGDGTVKLWTIAGVQRPRVLKGHRGRVRGVVFSPDGARLASASDDKTVKVWEAASGQCLRTLTGHGDSVYGVACTADGTRLASASLDRTVKLWDLASGQELHTLGHTGPVMSVAFSPDGKRLVSGVGDRRQPGQPGEVKLWDTVGGRELRIFRGHTGGVRSVAFSPDGKWLASASWDQTVKLWDAATGQELRPLMGHTGMVYCVAFTPDGVRLAAGGEDRTVWIWDAHSGKQLCTLRGHKGGIWNVTFSPDGTRPASASDDETVKVWEVMNGQELRTLKGHVGFVYGVAFSSDRNWLASAGTDGALRLWDARPLTSEVKTEVGAVSLLETLFSKPLPKSEVRAAIQRDKIVSDAARQKALELAERFKEETDPKKYHAAAWPVIRHPYANVFTCQFALAQMSAACERAPDPMPYRIALGVAQYRLGKFQKERYPEALATLTKCDQDQPATLAFLAMTQHQLGQEAKEQATLARLREIMKKPEWAGSDEAGAFLREAAGLVEGKPAQSTP